MWQRSDLFLFNVFDQALYRWMSSVSTMTKEDIVGLTAPMEEDAPGQLWMRYLEHTVADAVTNASRAAPLRIPGI